MEEIEFKENPLGIKVYIIGKQKIDHMSEEDFNLFISFLELRINEYLENKTTKE